MKVILSIASLFACFITFAKTEIPQVNRKILQEGAIVVLEKSVRLNNLIHPTGSSFTVKKSTKIADFCPGTICASGSFIKRFNVLIESTNFKQNSKKILLKCEEHFLNGEDTGFPEGRWQGFTCGIHASVFDSNSRLAPI